MRVGGFVAALLLLALGSVSGCGNAVVPVAGRLSSSPAPSASAPGTPSSTPSAASVSPQAPSSTPSGSRPTPTPTTLTVGDRQVNGWPAQVSLPPDVTIAGVTADARGGVLSLAATSRQACVGHLRAQLMGVGMILDLDTGDSFTFRGPGWSGQVVSDDRYVTVAWSLGDWVPGRRGEDLGLATGVPRLLTYLAGSTATNTKLQSAGSSYDLVGRTPAELLTFYGTELPRLFTVTGYRSADGVTTLMFTDREYDSVITATDATFRMVHAKRR